MKKPINKKQNDDKGYSLEDDEKSKGADKEQVQDKDPPEEEDDEGGIPLKKKPNGPPEKDGKDNDGDDDEEGEESSIKPKKPAKNPGKPSSDDSDNNKDSKGSTKIDTDPKLEVDDTDDSIKNESATGPSYEEHCANAKKMGKTPLTREQWDKNKKRQKNAGFNVNESRAHKVIRIAREYRDRTTMKSVD